MLGQITVTKTTTQDAIEADSTTEEGVPELSRADEGGDTMRATLEFSLPEEREELDHALKGTDAVAVLHAMDNYLRERLKYHELTDEVATVLQEVRTKLHEEVDDHMIPLW